MKRLSALFVLAVVALVLGAPTAASAHAELVSSNPGNSATIQTMPREVSLTLSESVREPAFVVVAGKDGTRLNSDVVMVRGSTVTSTIDGAAPAGAYTMSYRIVSDDGHAVTGTVPFTIAGGATPTPTPSPTTGGGAATSATPTPAGGVPTEAVGAPTTAQTIPDEPSTAADALTVIGFAVLAMAGLILLIRAGMRMSDSEDID